MITVVAVYWAVLLKRIGRGKVYRAFMSIGFFLSLTTGILVRYGPSSVRGRGPMALTFAVYFLGSCWMYRYLTICRVGVRSFGRLV